MRGVRFLEHGAVIPHGAGAIRGDGLDFALPDAAEHGAFGGIREEGGNLCRLVCASAEMRGIIERTGVGAARNLIPLASVRSCDERVRARRPIKLGGAEHLYRGLLAIGSHRLCADASAAYLRILQLTPGKLRHVILKTAIGDISTDTA